MREPLDLTLTEAEETAFWQLVGRPGSVIPLENGLERTWASLEGGEEVISLEDCALWSGPVVRGYPIFNSHGRQLPAQRVAYVCRGGEIPPGKFVRQKCGNKRCLSELHLYAGDVAENRRLHPLNENRNPRRRHHLSAEQVYDVRLRAAKGASQVELAERFKVNRRTIANIVQGKTRA